MMRKNLLTAAFLSFGIAVFAQQDLTYIGQEGKFFVSSGALVYSGGNWTVNSNEEKAVENNGNIIIVGDYKKGSATAAADGKEFVNTYTSLNDYGQVKILNTTGANTNALMTVQRLAAPNTYFGGDFPISVPFKDGVSNLMRSFGKTASEFRGSCPIDVVCGNRYTMTLNKWNNDKIQGDAVPVGENFKPGDYYFLNLRPAAGLQTAMTGTIGYKGTPAPGVYSATGKSVIVGVPEATFNDLGYNDWKTKINPYNEKYESYMGYYNSTNKYVGKNIYRFGNPYTSNIDISGVNGANAWLRIKNNGGNRTIQEAYAAVYIKDFTIKKRTSLYDITWNPSNGTTNVFADYHTAVYNGTQWTGHPEALIIRPLETFNVVFPQINPTALGSRIVNIGVGFSDFHKTFAYPAASGNVTPGNGFTNENNSVGKSTVTNEHGFNQLELFLVKNNEVQAAPIYLVGTNYSEETSPAASTDNTMFLYGMNNGVKVENSKKTFNEFNSDTYIGKPLSLGFNNLVEGESYELRVNLYENDIFNNVKNLSDGRFLIKDKLTNTVSEFSTTQSFSFVAGANISNRYDIYWKEVQGATLGSDNVAANSKTLIYKFEEGNKIKFEKESKFADLDFYDMSGKLISTKKEVSTASDYAFVLPISGVYVVKVVYKNGIVRNLKVIK